MAFEFSNLLSITFGFFFLFINELPYEDRFKIENMLLVALWFGDKKPLPNLFLQPLLEPLKELFNGINVYVEDLKEDLSIRGILMCGTGDLPALALFILFNMYNGKFGCMKCVQKGLTVEKTRVYPYIQNIILRNEQNVEEWAEQALEIGKPVCGVKGISILSKLCYKYVSSTAIDIMHLIAGIVKKLGELHFDSKYAGNDYNISHLVEVVDEKLRQVKPPSHTARRPRSIKTHFKYWKASELHNWFFYYSLPVLHGILPSQYFDHYKYFVLGIYTLSQQQIPRDRINFAEALIDEFTSRFELLYGIKQMSPNLHNARHLAEMVRRLGPLYTTSCFALEDLNGKIKALVHSSKNPELQITKNLSILIKVHALRHEWLKNNKIANDFCNNTKKRLKLTSIENSIFAVGTITKMKESSAREIMSTYSLVGSNIFLFKKIYKNKIVYYSELSQKDLKTESHFVSYNENNVNERLSLGIVQSYIRITSCDCSKLCECAGKNYAIIKKLTTVNPFTVNVHLGTLKFIHKCTEVCDIPSLIEIRNDKMYA